MTQDEIKHDLLQVCKVKGWDGDFNIVGFHVLCDKLKQLGVDKEREACAKTCEKVAVDYYTRIGGEHMPYMKATAEDCAMHIRARGTNMTDKEALKLAQIALENLEHSNFTRRRLDARIAIKQALALPVQEPVAHTVIAGALFDFMGYLTSRKERIVLSASDDAAPAADAIRDFATKRGLSLDDAQVREWIDALAQPELWCMKMNGCKTKCEDCPDKPPEERNFCPRCGYRIAIVDLTTIHTCTPPQENT